jgi:hypothetical protein
MVTCSKIGIDRVIATPVAEHLDLDAKLIGNKTKQRAIVLLPLVTCALAVDRLMLTGMYIARRLYITPSAVKWLAACELGEPALLRIERT